MATLTPNNIAGVIVEVGGFAPMTLLKPFDSASDLAKQQHNPSAAIAWLDVAIAVCLSESGGNTSAANPSSNARGLWQIMTSVHGAKIEDASKFWSTEIGKSVDIMDPYVNTQCASWIYQDAGGWSPWEAYNTGAYKRFSGKGRAAYAYINSPGMQARLRKRLKANMIDDKSLAESVAGLPGGGLFGGIDNPMTAWVTPLLSFAKGAGIAIGTFLLAGVLVILGIWFLVSQTNVGRSAKRTVRKALPV